MGTGKIQQRGQNSWRVSVYVGRDPDTGKRRDIARTVRGTRKDAEQELLRLRIDTGTSAAPAGTWVTGTRRPRPGSTRPRSMLRCGTRRNGWPT